MIAPRCLIEVIPAALGFRRISSARENGFVGAAYSNSPVNCLFWVITSAAFGAGVLGDCNDLELLTGCTDYIPNSFADQKLRHW